MFRSKNSNTASSSGDGGGRGEGANSSSNSSSGSLVPRFASLFFRKRPPKKRRKRPEIKLVLGEDGGGKGGEKKAEKTRGEGEAAPLELRAKEDKDAANRQTRDRIVLIESQSSAASGEKSNSSCDAPAAGTEDSNRRTATPSGMTLLSFTIPSLYEDIYHSSPIITSLYLNCRRHRVSGISPRAHVPLLELSRQQQKRRRNHQSDALPAGTQEAGEDLSGQQKYAPRK